MAERAYYPSSPACGHWETLLADALDGMLRPEDETVFADHKASCPACASMYEEARRGREWMEFLAPEPEVPAGLYEKILAGTEHGIGHEHGLHLAGQAAHGLSALVGHAGGQILPEPTLWQRKHLPGFLHQLQEPRLMMTMAMAFFSVALTLNMTGVKPNQLKASDLRPASIRSVMERRLTMASTPVVRYYDHLRFVYEVQTRMRRLKHSSEIEELGKQTPEAQPLAAPAGQSDPGQPAPGQSRKQPAPERRQQAPEVLQSNLTNPQTQMHSGGSAEAERERNTPWIA